MSGSNPIPGFVAVTQPGSNEVYFRELARGALFGQARSGSQACLQAMDEEGRDVGDKLFDCGGGQIRLRKSLMPAMLTRDTRVIRQDCLCYLMERLHYDPAATTRP